jgi:hypothetical protein
MNSSDNRWFGSTQPNGARAKAEIATKAMNRLIVNRT